ncbi:MAG TPA: hypothetical protein PLN13_05630 [Bacteroidia bacterium]|nr:hypothetical protein [Bacteroidia bacterium]HRH08044.1 hypothetical protein [Bacteroidia bacterium]
MKKIKQQFTLRILVLLIGSMLLSLTSDKLILHKRVYTQGNYFTTDNLGNCYLVDKNEITKYDVNGTVFNKFSIKAFGTIQSMDASNPMKLMVFYKDFSKIVYLDNTLSLNGNPLDLEELNLTQAKLICASHSDGIWLFNQQKFELIRLDKNLEVSQTTSNINQLLGIELAPTYLCEYANLVYLNNPETGIVVFDIYGTYVKTIPILHLNKFQVINDMIYYLKDNKAVSYNLKTLVQNEIKLPDMKYTEVRTEKGMLYVQSAELIDLLKVE